MQNYNVNLNKIEQKEWFLKIIQLFISWLIETEPGVYRFQYTAENCWSPRN